MVKQFFDGQDVFGFVAVRCVNVTCADKKGCSKSYFLDLSDLCMKYWSAIVYNAEVAVKFSELPCIQNYPDLP